MNLQPLSRLPRVDFNRQICVAPVDGTGSMERLWAVNVSLGGLCVRSAAPLPPGTRVRLSLDGTEQLLPFGEAEVVWQKGPSRPGEELGGFGLRFIKLKDAGARLVETLVRHGGSSTAPLDSSPPRAQRDDPGSVESPEPPTVKIEG